MFFNLFKMNFQNGNNKFTYFLEEKNPKDNYPSINYNQYKKEISEISNNNNYNSQNDNYISNIFNKLNKNKINNTPILTTNTTFDYKKDLKKIGISYDSSDSENNSYNNINTDCNNLKIPHYKNNFIKYDINDNIYDNNNVSLMTNQTLNNNKSNLQNSKNIIFKKGNGTEALSNFLSDLTKNKMKKIELAKRSTYLNPFGNNNSYLNIHNYIRENYTSNKDSIQFHSRIPSNDFSNLNNYNINKSRNSNQDDNELFNQNKRMKKINNNISNDNVNDKEKIKMKLNQNEIEKESENEYGEFEEFESADDDKINNKNDNNNFYTFNNNNLSNIENKNSKNQMNFSNDNISNIQDDNFLKFLKDENEKLKNLNNTYKQLIDSLFYFVNELSHKFSYYQELFDISYYVNHVDDLSKTLIGLEYCILSQSNPKNGKNFEEFKKSINSNFYKQFKLPLPLKIINEISFEIPENENNIINTFNNSNINNSKIDTSNQSSLIKKKKSKSQSKNNSNLNILSNKKEHDCIACNLGYSISKKGYSTMAYSPYNNTSNSIKNSKSESNRNLIKQIPKSLSQKNSTKQLKKI